MINHCTICDAADSMETLIWSESGETADMTSVLEGMGVFSDYIELYRCTACGSMFDADIGCVLSTDEDIDLELEELDFGPDKLTFALDDWDAEYE